MLHGRHLAVSLPALLALAPAGAFAAVIPTSFGIGADAEVRDHQPTTNFGASTELASRIVDNFPAGHANEGSDRFSAMYLKFDLTGSTLPEDGTASVRVTWRNTNLTTNRVHDTSSPNLEFRTGLAFYGLDRDHAGNAWSEATLTYSNAPGLNSDGNNGTKDYDFVDPDGAGPIRAPLTPLGVGLFPEVPPQNHLPVGGEVVLSSASLTNFVEQALNDGKQTVTIVAALVHDGKVPVNDWKNFNYLFNPKEQTTLTADAGYDADTTDPNNALGSPWSGASNATDANGFSPFSPQLILVPEPGAFALAALAGAGALARRRRG
jgi:hypothetical protein